MTAKVRFQTTADEEVIAMSFSVHGAVCERMGEQGVVFTEVPLENTVSTLPPSIPPSIRRVSQVAAGYFKWEPRQGHRVKG